MQTVDSPALVMKGGFLLDSFSVPFVQLVRNLVDVSITWTALYNWPALICQAFGDVSVRVQRAVPIGNE
jgi:hypothetical protein